MPVYIHNIATLVPEQAYEQQFLRDRMKEYIGGEKKTGRIIHRIYSNSGIKKRHTIINDFNRNGSPRFLFQKNGILKTPSTGERNKLYTKKAKKLFVEVAEKAIRENPSVALKDITHVITVSCTGFFAPGPGFEIIKQLGLSSGTRRFHVGFMGCFAAFPALKMAKSFCESQPDAKVLVVCLELCSLHLQDSELMDHLISASVFADGAAGLIVSSDKPIGQPGYELGRFSSAIAEQSEKAMAWTIGDTGFEMSLSAYVPEIIESNIEDALSSLFEGSELSSQRINHWAIHPGGRAILVKCNRVFHYVMKNWLRPARSLQIMAI